MAIGVDRSLTFRDLSNSIPEALRHLEMVFIQLVHQTFEMFVVCIYLINYSNLRGYLKPLHEWITEMIVRKPEAVFIVGGNFNCAH